MARRRTSRGRGTIEARGPKRWLVRVSLGRDPVTGKWLRLSKLVRGPRREAQVWLTAQLRKQDQGEPLPTTRLTLGEWLEEYRATWSGHLAPRTKDTAEASLKVNVPAELRGRRLASLRAEDFQALYRQLLEAGKSPGTIHFLHRVLRAQLGQAVKRGYLARNPVRDATPPKRDHVERRVLAPQEAQLFLAEAASDVYAPLWTLLLLTGMRPEEALGLTWADVDGGQVRVRRALVRAKGGGWRLEAPKTKKGERTVSLPPRARAVLEAHRKAQDTARELLGDEYAPHGFVFASALGEPLHWHNVTGRRFRAILVRVALKLRKEFPVAIPSQERTKKAAYLEAVRAAEKQADRVLEETGLDRFRPYDLRHSAASLLLAGGEHPKVVQETLGHANIAITLDTYSHLIPGLQERAAERLEAIIYSASVRSRGA